MAEQELKIKGAVSLADEVANLQFRLCLQGPGGVGKSWSCTTFSPTLFEHIFFLSFDRGLISHSGRKDISEIKFYDGKFVDTLVKRDGISCPPNVKDALTKWLNEEAVKLTSKHLLVVDANTGIQTAYHTWWDRHKEDSGFLTAGGKIDAYKEWRLKVAYYGEVMMALKGLQCSVIFIFHESPDRDDKGTLTGEVRPLITGQFQDELQTHFTDYYRAIAVEKPKSDDEKAKLKTRFKINDETLKEWIASTEAEHNTIYLWQTYTDRICKCKTSLKNPPQFVLANASTFVKYKRTNTQ